MRTRQRERKHLQIKKRTADSAAVTRKETELGDGVFRRQRKEAENHIAELICRFASFSYITGRYHFPKGKQQEVFELHATKTYSDLNVGFKRVRDRVYRLLNARKKDKQVEDEVPTTEEKSEDVSKYFYFTLFILVGLIKPCFVCMSVLLMTFYLFATQNAEVESSNRGCPIGSTNEQKILWKQNCDDAVTHLAQGLNKKMKDLTDARGPNTRLSGKEWDDLCDSVATKFKVPKPYLLKKKKRVTRVSQGTTFLGPKPVVQLLPLSP